MSAFRRTPPTNAKVTERSNERQGDVRSRRGRVISATAFGRHRFGLDIARKHPAIRIIGIGPAIGLPPICDPSTADLGFAPSDGIVAECW
jgi:hypothetical protein